MNPYQFVPLVSPAEPQPVQQHHKFAKDRHTGTLHCRIENLTELFVAGHQERVPRDTHQKLQFVRDGNTPIIPGSSLKGSIRSVLEALSGSCLILAGDGRQRDERRDRLSYWEKRANHDYDLDNGFAPCGMRSAFRQETKKACPACRMFGTLHRNEVHLGKVHFSRAVPEAKPDMQDITLEPFGAPGARHRAFYGIPETQFKAPRGRKFYFHRIKGARTSSIQSGQTKTVEACLPGAVFTFQVDYQDLSQDELALLVFSLILEEPMRHKIGMGKGVGLGSVKIDITGWQQIDIADRYCSIDGGKRVLPEDALQQALQAQRDCYHTAYANWQQAFASLRDIWRWDPSQPRDPQYPSFKWFKDNSQVLLENVPDDAGAYKVRANESAPQPRRFDHGRPQPERLQPAVDTAALKQVQREADERQKAEQEAKQLYQDREVEKARIVSAEGDSFTVELPKLPGKNHTVRKKNKYRPYQVNAKIRVRILVDGKGEITQVEEV
ncbi:hypothetical protein KC734_11010 [candidate division KSB1 bacterium]|nr:hypothetical protein [candidate division KSB1 bacterium]